jgi:uncharacterized membrane protein YkoI
MIHTPSSSGRSVTRRLRYAIVSSVVAAALIASAVARAPAPVDSTPNSAAPGGHADAARARESVHRGDFLPLERIAADATQRYPGRIVEVELEGDEYEIELLTADGVRVELEYDARTGELLEVEYDD